MAQDQEKDYLNTDGMSDDFSLESILAEYKGSAFIDGDKKTPPHILDEKAQRIVMEVTGTGAVSAGISSEGGAPPEPENPPPPRKEAAAASEEFKDEDTLFFENFRYSSPDTPADIADEVAEAVKKELALEQQALDGAAKALGIFGGDARAARGRRPVRAEWSAETQAEPDFREKAAAFGAACNALSWRALAAFLISVIMLIITFGFEAGKLLPFGIGHSRVIASGVLLILQLIVMVIGADALVKGAESLVKGAPGADTLVFIASLVCVLSGIYYLKAPGADGVLPYSAVCSFSLSFALWGERLYLQALADTLRTASTAAEPYAIVSEFREDMDRTILKKTSRRTKGFYSNLMQADICETAYAYAAPVLLTAAVVIALLASFTHSELSPIPHSLSAMISAAAVFPATLAFAAPFRSIAIKARRSGAAIAGAGGADDIYYTDGVCITDEDLFPTGTTSVSGLRIFEAVAPEKAIRYTASLIIASGSGLARVFSDILKSQNMSLIKVDDFICHEGGVSGLILGDRVMTGSAAFMNLVGIRIPDDMNLKNAVFTAVNDKLIAMCAVEYIPINSVQNALISVLKGRVKLFYSVRDFNMTPLMLEQKFKIPVDDVEYLPIQNTYDIADERRDGLGRVTAILTREGLGPVGETISGGKLLKVTALVGTAVSVVSSAAGVLLMAFLCWAKAFAAARPGNLLLFMFVSLIVTLGVDVFAKLRR